MSHPAVQTHPLQINPSWLQLPGTSEEQHDNITRTREAGQTANGSCLGQGELQQNSLFDQLVQPLSVQGRCILPACKFEDFVSNSLVIKLLGGKYNPAFSLSMQDNPVQLLLPVHQILSSGGKL